MKWLRCLLLLTLFACNFALADSYRELDAQLKDANNETAIRILKLELGFNSDLSEKVERLPKGLSELKAIISQRAAAEQATAIDKSWGQKVKSAKANNPLYRDTDKGKQTGNWLAKAYEKLGEAIENALKGRDPNLPDFKPPSPFFGQWLVYLMWGILGLLLAVFLFLAIRHFKWKARLKRKATALMDDDEPERSLDEWLAMADKLEREGKFREAVRCLYLACLLKFDEHHVARFDRGQTNWEHLQRIRASATFPPDLDFLSPTKAFDRVWYGMIVEGMPDVDRFRAWYHGVVDALKVVKK